MSYSSVNVNRNTDAADYLNWLRLYAQSNQLMGTGGTNIQPLYLLGLANTMNITDTLANNTQNSGTFLIDTAKIDFSDIG